MSRFLSPKGLTKNITRTIRTAKSSLLSTIGLPESHQEQQHTIQSIHTNAVESYRNDFENLLIAINYFNRKEINYYNVQSDKSKYKEVYDRMIILSSDFQNLLLKLNKKFIHCKSECERLRPELKEDFAKIARESPYAYVNTCKSLAVIDDCFEFNALFSIFEIPLRKLYRKFTQIDKSKLKPSIRFHINRFLENFAEFSELTGVKMKAGRGKRTRTLKTRMTYASPPLVPTSLVPASLVLVSDHPGSCLKHIRKTYKYKKSLDR